MNTNGWQWTNCPECDGPVTEGIADPLCSACGGRGIVLMEPDRELEELSELELAQEAGASLTRREEERHS